MGPKEGGLFGCQDEGMNVSFSSIAENQKEVKQLFVNKTVEKEVNHREKTAGEG